MLYVLLAGRPGPSFDKVVKEANEAIEDAASKMRFRKKQQRSRRGPFPTINVGFSSGCGNSVSFPNTRIRLTVESPHMVPRDRICCGYMMTRLKSWRNS